jgi:hypothetical protein
VDEDASEHAVVQGLRLRGIDILTTVEAGRSRATDEAQLAFAAAQGRAIYTFNVGDFARHHGDYLVKRILHHGVIVIPDQRYSVGEKIRRVAELLRRLSAEEMMNRMEYL